MIQCLLIVLFGLLVGGIPSLPAQIHKCGTMSNLKRLIAKDPSILKQLEDSKLQARLRVSRLPSLVAKQIITIPVVVHVLWQIPSENISDAQIQSQIDVLNKDYRLKNSDSLDMSHPFRQNIADANIEFCLANRDPNGKATTGITRTKTDSLSFVGVGNEKRTANGGIDNWNPQKYLNIWVCRLVAEDPILGYAAFPFELSTNPEDDGVVIDFQAFGTLGNVVSPNALGRTATHEIGHWLDLFHIWGDNEPNCGDDEVLDTAPGFEANYDCPKFPRHPNNKCGTDENGEMYMNFMDYVVDSCMNMFTRGQAGKMQNSLKGDRAGILTSLGCRGTSSIEEDEQLAERDFEIYPNPTMSSFKLGIKNYERRPQTIILRNILGEEIKTISTTVGNILEINVLNAPNGVYYLQIQLGNKTITKIVYIAE